MKKAMDTAMDASPPLVRIPEAPLFGVAVTVTVGPLTVWSFVTVDPGTVVVTTTPGPDSEAVDAEGSDEIDPLDEPVEFEGSNELDSLDEPVVGRLVAVFVFVFVFVLALELVFVFVPVFVVVSVVLLVVAVLVLVLAAVDKLTEATPVP